MARLRNFAVSSSAVSLALCVLILSAVCFAAAPDRITRPVTTASTVRLGVSGSYPRTWAQHDQGPIEPSFALHNLAFLVTPSPTQQKEIEKLLAEQQDPRSPNYHNWLTPEQYGARFGLSANDVKKITSWLRAQGFTAISVVRSANLITFSGTVAQVQVTFRTQIHRFDADGEQRFSNVSAPVIPAALSGIVTGVRGLNNYRLKPMVQRIRPDYAANNSFTEGVNKTV